MVTYSISRWVVYTLVFSAFWQFVVYVALHRFYAHRRTLKCLSVVTVGNGRTVRCALPRYHDHDHAATLEALRLAGYAQAPF
jgi:hypothetical protein